MLTGGAPVAAFALCALALGLAAVIAESDVRPIGLHTGYEPVQPVRYSHRLHAGELGMDCLACHVGAETSRHAGIPGADVCMGCHAQVTAGFDAVLAEREAAEAEGREPRRIVSAELRKLYDAVGLDAELRPDPARTPQPIAWLRVHDLPDFVYFDHRPHVARGLACQQCHGPVQTMERVRQFADLSMGWCVNCHRQSAADAAAPGAAAPHVSTDCARCHF